MPEKKLHMTQNIMNIFTRIDKLSSTELQTLRGGNYNPKFIKITNLVNVVKNRCFYKKNSYSSTCCRLIVTVVQYIVFPIALRVDR